MTCQTCGASYSLSRIGELGSTPRARCDRALAYSIHHEIDLASAYSVLLGILTLEECRTLPEDEGSSRDQSTNDSPPPHDGYRSLRMATYDEGFAPAVSHGYLTVQQAVMRGDRVAYASRLALRHRLSMRLAFLVADGRLTIRDALAYKPSAEETVERVSHASALRPYRAAAIFLGVTCVAAWGVAKMAVGTSESTRPSVRHVERVKHRVDAPAVQATAAVRLNPQGEVTQIVGHDPRSVLHALCSETSGFPCEALNVKPARDAWTGFYRQGKTVHRISIRRDELARHWVAGDGVHPIRPTSGS